MTQSNVQLISELLAQHGVKRHGFTSLSPAKTLDRYRNWLDRNLHGEMDYLKRHLNIKESPESRFQELRFAIVLALPYYPSTSTLPEPFNQLRVATYARGRDYHEKLAADFSPLMLELQNQFPEHKFQFLVDSSPILERDLAHRAGLGWFGKNTCLIDSKHGSLFFIAEILTTLNLSVAQVSVHPDRCGTCTRCLDACPTGAFVAPYVLDAKKCISYLTIEKKGDFSTEESKAIGSWVFGCDICQTVCPWNEKVFGGGAMSKEVQEPTETDALLKHIHVLLELSDAELIAKVKDTPLSRPKARGLRRNLSAVAENLKARDNNPYE